MMILRRRFETRDASASRALFLLSSCLRRDWMSWPTSIIQWKVIIRCFTVSRPSVTRASRSAKMLRWKRRCALNARLQKYLLVFPRELSLTKRSVILREPSKTHLESRNFVSKQITFCALCARISLHKHQMCVDLWRARSNFPLQNPF